MSLSESEYAEQEYLERVYNEFGPEWADEHADELYERYYGEAVNEFTTARLKSFYVAHPELAQPALQSLAYAQSLVSLHPAAALVFATTAIELSIKVVLLQPIICGLVHIDTLAPLVAEQCTQPTGARRFRGFLIEILTHFGGVNLREFKRQGSEKTLWQEVTTVQDGRNSVLHAFKPVDASTADLAITVAVTLLSDIFPQVLRKLDLHLHDPGVVCSKKHTTTVRVALAASEGLRAYAFTWNVEIHGEVASAEDMPDLITGRLAGRPSEADLAAVRSGKVAMTIMEPPWPLRYQFRLSRLPRIHRHQDVRLTRWKTKAGSAV